MLTGVAAQGNRSFTLAVAIPALFSLWTGFTFVGFFTPITGLAEPVEQPAGLARRTQHVIDADAEAGLNLSAEVDDGQHEREGRWWWEEATKKECGLHMGNVETEAVSFEIRQG